MSFLKFQQDPHREPTLHWHRADRDGAPFRGDHIPFLRDEEFDELAERVLDCKYAMYNTNKPDEQHHGLTYQQVLDGITARWYQLLSPRQYKWGEDEAGNPVMFVYIEWAVATIQVPNHKLAGKQSTSYEVSHDGTAATGSAKNQPRTRVGQNGH